MEVAIVLTVLGLGQVGWLAGRQSNLNLEFLFFLAFDKGAVLS